MAIVKLKPAGVSRPFMRLWMLRWLRRVFVVCWCVTVFCFSFELNTRHNDFPIAFHPDENTKVDQLQEDRRNFNHPLLMLEATRWLMDWKKVSDDSFEIVRTGREASALCAATAVMGFTLAGYFAAGLPGLLLASIGLTFCPSLIVYAHYMKEDAALISGFGVTAAGMAWVWNRRGWAGQFIGPLIAGAGVGLAASGKYVGAMAITGALAAVIAAPWRKWHWIPLRILLMAVAAVGTAAYINARAIDNWEDFRRGFDNEYEHGTTDHGGVTLPKPSRFIYEATRMESQPHVQVFVIALGLAILTLRRGWGGDLIMVMFAGACLWVLSMGAIPFHRYALPIVVMAHFLAALGAARWILQLRRRRILFIPALVCGVVLFGWLQGSRARDVLGQFPNDSRVRLAEWADQNLPARSRVVIDSYCLLNRTGRRQYDYGGGLFYAPQFGPIDELRRRGYYTVIVCNTNYDRYFAPAAMGSPDREDDFKYRKEWYEQIAREGKVLWQAKAEHPTYSFTNPDITVYSIKP